MARDNERPGTEEIALREGDSQGASITLAVDDLAPGTATALSRQPRRWVLVCLHRHEFMMPREAVARQLAAWRTETSVADCPTDERERVERLLRHAHLPKLADAGLVDYDRRSEMVALTPKAESLLASG